MDSPAGKPTVLIALPAKNEAQKIKEVLQSVRNVAQKLPNYQWTITVFDDASTDETKPYALSLQCNVHSLVKSRGLGHVFSAIAKTFLEGGYDYLVTMDADGQFDPAEIPCLLGPLEKGLADFTTGSRFLPESKTTNISNIKKFGNKLGARYVSSILKERFFDVTCGFRSYSREAILKLHTFSDFTYTQEVLLNLGIKKLSIVEIPITTIYYPSRKSKMVKSVFRYIAKSLKIILKSIIIYAPMRLFGTLGNLAFAIALLAGIFVFFWDQTTGSVTPYKWLGITGVTAGIVGALMYSVGILLQITSRLQLTAEDQLYYLKKQLYGKTRL